jgi:hypothetical protein
VLLAGFRAAETPSVADSPERLVNIVVISARIDAVPTISRFLGIVIMINYNEHDPPHFHARYARQKISVRIADGVVTGKFPARALAHVLEWWNLHRGELAEDWQLARQHMPLKPIEPLE